MVIVAFLSYESFYFHDFFFAVMDKNALSVVELTPNEQDSQRKPISSALAAAIQPQSGEAEPGIITRSRVSRHNRNSLLSENTSTTRVLSWLSSTSSGIHHRLS